MPHILVMLFYISLICIYDKWLVFLSIKQGKENRFLLRDQLLKKFFTLSLSTEISEES